MLLLILLGEIFLWHLDQIFLFMPFAIVIHYQFKSNKLQQLQSLQQKFLFSYLLIDIQFELRMLEFNSQNQQDFQRILKKNISEVRKVKFIDGAKWRKLMLHHLEKMQTQKPREANLIHDLRVIVSKITEQDFIKTTLEIKPFKPTFQNTRLLKSTFAETTTSTTATKLIINHKSKQLQTHEFFSQATLGKQFMKPYHPFNIIINGFIFIIDKKYQMLANKKVTLKYIEQIQDLLRQDIKILLSLIVHSGQPYINILKAQDQSQKIRFKHYLNKFITNHFIPKHPLLSKSIFKIMRFYSNLYISSLNVELQKDVSSFGIPEKFAIDGLYIRAMNSLMEYCEVSDPTQSLNKLIEFRHSIFQDIDFYYKQIVKSDQYREITADIQLDIIKFILNKLRGWLPQIFASLRFLEVIYGDEQIAYKYDDASYLYAQISTAFQALLL